METPNGISQLSWNKARHLLSNAFTVPIGHRLVEVTELANNIDSLEAYDFKLVTWEDFLAATDRSTGLLERAKEWHKQGGFDIVIYDPLDDEQGFMLVGNDPVALSREACAWIASGEPEEGPLSVDNYAMAQVEAA